MNTDLFELDGGLKDICEGASASVLASSSGIWTVESGSGVMEEGDMVRDDEDMEEEGNIRDRGL